MDWTSRAIVESPIADLDLTVVSNDLAGLLSVEDIRRVLEIAVIDTLGLDNPIARTRVLVALAAAARLLEVDDLGAFRIDSDDEA